VTTAGDQEQEDAGFDDEWEDHSQIDGGRARSVLVFLARRLVDEPDAITVQTSETRNGIKLSLRVSPDDMGKVIGRRGRRQGRRRRHRRHSRLGLFGPSPHGRH
jgi:hypothetical protein